MKANLDWSGAACSRCCGAGAADGVHADRDRGVGQRRGVGHQLPRRRADGDRRDQREGRHPQAQDQRAGERHAEQRGHLARPGAEGDRRRPVRDPRPGVLRLGEGEHGARAAGRDPADDRRGGRRDHADGQRLHLPHLVRAADEHAEDGDVRGSGHQGEDGGVPVGEQRLRQGRARRVPEGDGGAQHQGRRRRLDRVGPGGFRRRRRQAQGGERGRDLHLHQRGGVRARAARGAQAGRQGSRSSARPTSSARR